MRATGTVVSSVGHAALLSWGLFSFAPEPLNDKFVETIPIEFVTTADVTDLTKGLKTADAVIDSEETAEQPDVISETVSPDQEQAEQVLEDAEPPPQEPTPEELSPEQPVETKAPEPPPAPQPAQPEVISEAKQPPPSNEARQADPIRELIPSPGRENPVEVAKAPEPGGIEELIAQDTKTTIKAAEEKPESEASLAPAPRLNPRPKLKTAAATPNQLLDKQPRESASSGEAVQQASVGTSAGRTGAPLTQSELDGLRDAIQRCWTLPAGYSAGQDFRATVRAQLTKDGRVAGNVDVIDVTGFSGGSSFLIKNAVKVALQTCAPYRLPAAKYERWKNLEVTFYP